MKNIIKIFTFTTEFRPLYIFMGVFIIISSLLSFVGPFLLKQIVDIISSQFKNGTGNIQMLMMSLMWVLAADVAGTIVTAYGQWIGDIMSIRLQNFLSSKFYKHILDLDVGYFDNISVGDLSNKMSRGIASITQFIGNTTNNFLPFFLTALVTIGILAFYSPLVAFLLAILFPIYVMITHKSSTAWGKYEQEKNGIADVAQGRVLESLSGIRVVKAFLSEPFEYNRFVRARESIESITKQQTKEWHVYDFYRRIALNVILFFILFYILYETFHGRFSLGEMTLLIQLVNQARFPLFAMSYIIGQIQQADAGSRDFFNVLSTKRTILDIKDATNLIWPKNTKTPSLAFENVSFSYDKKAEVLKNISFSLGMGEKLALVGESGQGKSTMVNLMLRYYGASEGVIRLGGKNVNQVTAATLRKHISIVFQDALLFSGTIAENIRYGNPDATDAQMHEAAKLANAEEFILQLADGYDTTIGERGVKLSGGQKQRLAIARAILHDAPFIILDEATSALDSKSEVLVQKGLDHLMHGKSTIIIAHRLSTLSGVDKVLVLQNGQIAQFGSPKELLKAKSGMYSKMITLQQSLLGASAEERLKALQKYDLVG
ncbi:ABC transporter ATP-binding protein [Candidatus Woesebacteria bacterium]|nr:ABC transporter ATP-binding protein [Candidatus Woesebacteria bacterium]